MGIFAESAMEILRERYLLKNIEGQVVEDGEAMLRRVAGFVASAEKERDCWEERFYEIMAGLRFLPNSPTLANAGRPGGQLAACFVLPVPDSVEGIFEAVKKSALIHKTGGGTGFSFSKIRPRNDIVSSTGGVASGPVPFIRAFNCATDVVKQGGMRRGANMAVLDYWHPDIMEFIRSKEEEGTLDNFNISVGVDERFMAAVSDNSNIDLINPRTGKPVKSMRAGEIFDLMVKSAWENGEPGILFFDHINSGNALPVLGPMRATNPCGEQPLFDYESCNLGSLNLVSYLKTNVNGKPEERIDWGLLGRDIYTAVRFLDDVIDVNYYVFPEVEEITRANRKIGLGAMGFADLLIELGIPYASRETLEVIDRLMDFIGAKAREASAAIAEEKGSFPNVNKSIFKGQAMRNATVLTVAPTGTLSMLAEVSSGIEPLFGLSFVKEVLNGKKFVITNRKFEQVAKQRGFWSEELMDEITGKGRLTGITGIPEDVKRVFETSFDITPEWHVRVQAAFQKYVDNAVSKTVNFPNEATVDDIRDAYMAAWKLGCKGLTIYRTGSREAQVLKFGGKDRGKKDIIERCPDCTY